ncbi:hypothetical protein B9S53_14535 [Arthrospira sp. O9.13F]|nr:hypothetical protein B9S53_14535 [Arthrospira sp. O9.13F]
MISEQAVIGDRHLTLKNQSIPLIAMNQVFNSTASALCYSIICDRTPTEETREFYHNDVVRFVLEQHRRMPDYLQFPIWLLTVIFDCWGWLNASPFHRQPHQLRRQQIEAWKNSPFSPCRDLMRFYESLVVLCWQSLVNSNQCDRHV